MPNLKPIQNVFSQFLKDRQAKISTNSKIDTDFFDRNLLDKTDLHKIKHFDINSKCVQDVKQIRDIQWDIYQDDYFKLVKIIESKKQSISRFQSKCDFPVLTATDLAFSYNLDYNDLDLMTKEDTNIAIISCIDEATQEGRFTNEIDLDGNKMDPYLSVEFAKKDKYVLDIPGSGALNYMCPLYTGESCQKDILSMEKTRGEDLANRISMWCKSRGIVKLVVTYHEGCGAVSVRCNNFPFANKMTEIEEAKKCAMTLGKNIQTRCQVNDHEIEITVGFIGSSQICDLRPMKMHNGMGTIGMLDSRFLGGKMDNLTKINFFDVLIGSDFTEGEIKSKFTTCPNDNSVKNLSISTTIAMGTHGWGWDFFSKSRPFLMLMMARGGGQELEAQEIGKLFSKKYPETANKIEYCIIRTDL